LYGSGDPAGNEIATAAAAAAGVRRRRQICGQLRMRVRLERGEDVGRRPSGHAVQTRDDMGRRQPQRAVEDFEHVRLQGELQPADDADGQLGRQLVAGPSQLSDRQQLDDNAGPKPRLVGRGGLQRQGQRRRRRQPADHRAVRTRGHVDLIRRRVETP